ncbi:MAG TPA: hypothetical protein PKC96_04945 [Bacilli bacterium]|nr:hypothetical protein [Bacilli bacterium]
MNRISELISRYQAMTYRQRAHFSSTASMIGNFIFAFVKIIVSIFLGSIFIAMSGFATLAIGTAKIQYFRYLYKGKSPKLIPITLLIFCFIYISYMIVQIIFIHQSVDIGTIPAIAVAAVSFFEIGLAISGLIRATKKTNRSLFALKVINLCSALTAIVLTQSVLLALNTGSFSHYIYDAGFGIGIGAVCALMAIMLLIKDQNNN